MTQDEIKTKATALAAFYTAVSEGKQLQFHYGETFPIWVDCKPMDSPRLSSDLSYYRIKPEPRRMWSTIDATTFNEEQAAIWKKSGAYNVTEWMEVLP